MTAPVNWPREIWQMIAESLKFPDKISLRHTCSRLLNVIQIKALPPKYTRCLTCRELELFPHMESLTLLNYQIDGYELARMTALQSLYLHYVPRPIDLSGMRGLKKLSIWASLGGYTFKDVQFVTQLVQLKYLQLYVNDEICLNPLTNLETLILEAPRIDISHIDSLTNLKNLALHGKTQICDTDLKRFTRLETIFVQGLLSYGLPNLREITTSTINTYSPTLEKSLKALRIEKLSDDFKLEKFQNLQCLYIRGNRNDNTRPPIEGIKLLTGLKFLSLCRYQRHDIGDYDVFGLTNLETLELLNKSNWQPSLLLEKVSRLKSLKLRNIRPHVKLEYWSLDVPMPLTNLTKLYVYCTQLDWSIFKYLKVLQYLYTADCEHIVGQCGFNYVHKLDTLSYNDAVVEYCLYYVPDLRCLSALYTPTVAEKIKRIKSLESIHYYYK